MLDYNPNLEWVDEQQFTADGTPIPISGYPLIPTEAVPRMMTPPETDKTHEANVVAQDLKSAWLKGAKEFMGGSGMLNSKKDIGGRNKPVKRVQSLKTSEKPGWIMAEGTNFWVVNETDPYWQTPKGYKEAMDLYGFKPGWIKEPEEEKIVVSYQAPRRMSL